MPNIGIWEILLIVVVIVLLFGARKLPELARSVGRSMRIFKSEVKEMKDEGPNAAKTASEPAEEDFWNSPDNQPRRIAQQSSQATQQYQSQPNQQNQ